MDLPFEAAARGISGFTILFCGIFLILFGLNANEARFSSDRWFNDVLIGSLSMTVGACLCIIGFRLWGVR